MQSDVAIIGSSFSGSLLAWILAKAGRKVVLIDPARHPRFAIGESSTPLADFLLEQIAERFSLPELRALSRYGTWCSTYPELRRGKKRGFSYFLHRGGSRFEGSDDNQNSLLVAASENDMVSDTHWYRPELDHWFYEQATAQGATAWVPWRVNRVMELESGWRVTCEFACESTAPGNTQDRVLTCKHLVDASGSSGCIANLLGIPKDKSLKVHTSASFGHFSNVQPMSKWLATNSLDPHLSPFDCDHAAQHHILDASSGWVWMLRFDHGITSVGWVRPTHSRQRQTIRQDPASDSVWEQLLATYPTLHALLSSSVLEAPVRDGVPQLGAIERISRLWTRASGTNWWMLPNTAGLIDPLHSTGIAHALYGVERVGEAILNPQHFPSGSTYSQDIVSQVHWIDELVETAYRAQSCSFDCFIAACALYFVSAIHSERQMSNSGKMRDGFLLHSDPRLRELATWFSGRLEPSLSRFDKQQILEEFRKRLEPWNDVGLLEPSSRNRVSRAAAPK